MTMPIPSQSTLEDTLPRAIRFLAAVGTRAAIRRQLNGLGYTQDEHRHGWSLVHNATGFDPAAPPDEEVVADLSIRVAFTELDASDETWFRQLRASLSYSHPEVAQRLLGNLKPATGPSAAAVAAALVERVAGLRDDTGKTPEQIAQDRDAADKLARRGFDEAWIAHVRELVATTQRLNPPAEPEEAEDPEADDPAEALLKLYCWYKEWSELARTRITRRDWLISLGLATRRSTTSPPTEEDPAPTTPDEDLREDDEA